MIFPTSYSHHAMQVHLLTQLTYKCSALRCVASAFSSLYQKHYIGNSERVNRERFRTQLVNLTLPVDHASCAEENDNIFLIIIFLLIILEYSNHMASSQLNALCAMRLPRYGKIPSKENNHAGIQSKK